MHERELADYKLKLHSFESEVDKLTSRLHRALAEKDRLESKLECSQTELGRSKAELDKAATDIGRGGDWDSTRQRIQRLEIENERLRNDLERSQVHTSNNQILGYTNNKTTQNAPNIQILLMFCNGKRNIFTY